MIVYSYIFPKHARAYICSNPLTNNTLAATPLVLTPFVRKQIRYAADIRDAVTLFFFVQSVARLWLAPWAPGALPVLGD